MVLCIYKESYFGLEFLRSFSNYLNPFYPRLSAAFGSIAKFFVGAQNLIACTARVWRGVRVRIARARPFRTLLWHLVRRLSFSTNPPTQPLAQRTVQCTEVRFASFLSGGFTTMAVINPTIRKMTKRTSVQWCVFPKYLWQSMDWQMEAVFESFWCLILINHC